MPGPTMGLVAPEEWRKRTGLVLSRRSESTLRIDEAYVAYHRSHSEADGRVLFAALDAYVGEKGGSWDRSERDKASKGLMRYLHDHLRRTYFASSPVPAGLAALQRLDIPHSRFGVLYLFGNIEVGMNVGQAVFAGIGAVGGAIGEGLIGNSTATVMGHEVKGRTLVKGGQLAARGLGVAFKTDMNQVTPNSGVSTPRDRTVAPLQGPMGPAFGYDARIAAASQRGAQGGALAKVHGAADQAALYVAKGATFLYNQVASAVDWLVTKIMGILNCRVAGTVVAAASKMVVGQIMQSAAPFIGGAIDLGTGIARTLTDMKARIEAWSRRRTIVLNPGHPEMLASGIQGAMEQGMGVGLIAALKGAATMALHTFLPGMASLVAAIVSAVEYLVKLIMRLWEETKIKRFLQEAQTLLYSESKRGSKIDDDETGKTRLEPNLDPKSGGIIHDLDRFKTFYAQGCEASPCIPMLTLNSGICGSLMTLMSMFEDTGERAMASQEAFDAGNAYFTGLKSYSRNYFEQCGLKFSSSKSNVQELLRHAMTDHQQTMSKTDKVLGFVGGVG